ncbi:SEC-C domain-containing protein (plasmid) [Mycobacterium sp. SMC-8]|uniref:SEC-C metal-binding domain-containing protein n=1 Tax=Mycobacterium sp. SMC-8 TaxID=2857060 RepID=UPI00220006C9|nr:SEC-C domain-containing protein [Mycobacterium sp. SMC-8]
MDPLAPLGRNEMCWCGSGVKYKRCHGNHRPGSQPGAPLPPDLEGSVFLSPTVNMAGDAITVPEGGAPSGSSRLSWLPELSNTQIGTRTSLRLPHLLVKCCLPPISGDFESKS